MTIKKSLFTAAVVSSVAIAGTGIASAEDLPDTTFSADSSLEGADLSGQAGDLYGSVNEDTGKFGIEEGVAALLALAAGGAAVAGSIAILPNIYNAVKEFQDFADEVSSNLPPLPTF